MPDPTQTTDPKGQPRGAKVAQQSFDQQTAPLPPEAPQLTPEQQGLVDEDFGDVSEMLFGPTQSPGESPFAEFRPGNSAVTAPPPSAVRALTDKRVPEQLRATLAVSLFARLASPGNPEL